MLHTRPAWRTIHTALVLYEMHAGLLRACLLVQVFRLSFGPKSFVVVSDAEVARYMLMTNAGNYTKGVLSEILDFVMGKGGPPSAHGQECTLQCFTSS